MIEYIVCTFLPSKFSVFYSWEKSISRKKKSSTTPYYPISALLSVKLSLSHFGKSAIQGVFFFVFFFFNSICVPSLSFLHQSRKTKCKRWEKTKIKPWILSFYLLSVGMLVSHRIITQYRFHHCHTPIRFLRSFVFAISVRSRGRELQRNTELVQFYQLATI